MPSDFIVVGQVRLEGATSAAELDKQLGAGGLGGAASEADGALAGLGATSAATGVAAEEAAVKHGKLGGVFSSLTSHGLSLNGAMMGLAGTFAGGFVALEAGKWIIGGVEGAAKMEQQVAILNHTLEVNSHVTAAGAEQVDKWINSTARQYGVSHEQLEPAFMRLDQATHSVTESQKLMDLAMNISAGTGKSVTSVAVALGRAYDGSTGSLARYGIQTKDAHGKTLDFEQLMAKASKTFGGDAAKAADTTAGRMAVLGETFSQEKQKLMVDLIPAVNALLTGLTDVVGYLPTIAGAFKSAWQGVIDPVVMKVWNDGLKYVFDAMETDMKVQIKVSEAFAQAVVWSWKNVIGPTVSVVWSGIIKPIWDLEVLEVKTIMTVVQVLASAFQTAWNTMGSVLTTVWNATLKPLFDAIERFIKDISKALGLVGSVAKTVGGTVSGALKGAESLFAGNLDNMSGPGSGGSSSGVPANVQSIVSMIAGHLGWSVSDWDKVIMRESGGSMTARNSSSGAYGIAQFIQGPSEYYEWGGNPNTLQGQLIAMANYISCLPLDTEILTKRGWLSYEDVQVGDETIGYDPRTGKSRWTTVTAVHLYDDAPIVRLDGKRVRLRCTPNHRWATEKLVQSPRGNERCFEMARADAIGSRHRIIMAALHEQDCGLSLSLAEAELLGWLAGDGYVRRGPHSRLDALVHQSKTGGLVRLRAILGDLPHTEHAPRPNGVVGFRLAAPYARDLFSRSGFEGDLSAMVLAMSTAQRNAFLAGLMGADGCATGSTPVFCQNEGPVLDAAILASYLGGFFGRPYDAAGQKHLSLARPFISAKHGFAETGEQEGVWCVTTDLGTWTARQAGQVFLTGNSRYKNPTNAWSHEVAHGWYDKGGWLPQGLSLALNLTGGPEPVGWHGSSAPAGNSYYLAVTPTPTEAAMIDAMIARAT